MTWHRPSRLHVGAALLVLSAITPAFARGPAQKPKTPPAVRENRPAAQPRAESRPAAAPNAAVRAAQNQDHLQQWMENHKNLSLADQQRALQNEPGFRELPAQVQQRELNQLGRRYNMPQPQRDRKLERNEILEHMSAPQLQQYHGAVQAFAAMSPDRRRLTARAILDLREMPPDQREQVINSQRFAGQFSDSERSTIHTLLSVEPYPPAHAAPTP